MLQSLLAHTRNSVINLYKFQKKNKYIEYTTLTWKQSQYHSVWKLYEQSTKTTALKPLTTSTDITNTQFWKNPTQQLWY